MSVKTSSGVKAAEPTDGLLASFMSEKSPARLGCGKVVAVALDGWIVELCS